VRLLQVSAGKDFSCGLRPNGAAVCWGDQTKGKTRPPWGLRFKQLSVSSYSHYACGLTIASDSSDTDAGANAAAGAGAGSRLEGESPSSKVAEGSIACWGERHASGYSGKDPRPGPYTQVSTGNRVTCGIRAPPDGHIECWGLSARIDTTKKEGDHAWEQVTSGYQHTCGINAYSEATCWGPVHDEPGLNARDVPEGLVVA